MPSLPRLDSAIARSPPSSAEMRRIGTYELLRRLGSGGMAEVWMARRVSAEGITKSVALKLLTSRADDERYRRMFIDEARLSMLLNHSNIVQVFDVGVDQGIYYLAMEWVDGLNLAQLSAVAEVRELALSHTLAAHVVGEILQALAYAHTVTHEGRPLALIHRDVSPQNVLVSLSGGIKLADFGIARLAHDETSGLYVKGKLRYMAPEQLSGASRAPTVDLYAVGVILHELLGGVRFREGDDEAAIIAQISAAEIPELRRSDVPPELEALRRGLLEPDPKVRIQSATQALERLAAWPGYRNETLALAHLCRACAGVEAPRASVELESDDGASTLMPILGGAAPVSEGRPRRRSVAAWVGVGGALVGGLAVGVLVLGDRGGTLSSREDDAVVAPPLAGDPAAAASPALGADAPLPLDDGAPPAKEAGVTRGEGSETIAAVASSEEEDPGGAAAVDATGGQGTSAAPEAPADPGPSAKPAPADPRASKGRPPTPRASQAPARVLFKVTGGSDSFLFVEIRLHSAQDAIREFVVEPQREVQLAPGRYRVEYRTHGMPEWRWAGEIRIRGDGDYEVWMSRGGAVLRDMAAP